MTTITDPGCSQQRRHWMFYELTYVRREAQIDADLAYEAWCLFPRGDRYVVYRAAQDRADAAQDELSAWVRGDRHPLSVGRSQG
jgi:hypothetical protein